jgi:hypothetical protein
MASIPGPAVEDLEARLKSDVLAEALACGGRILVHRESRPASALPATGDSLADDTGAAPVVEPYWCVWLPSSARTGAMRHHCFACASAKPSRTDVIRDTNRQSVAPDGVLTPLELSVQLRVRSGAVRAPPSVSARFLKLGVWSPAPGGGFSLAVLAGAHVPLAQQCS